MALPRVRPSLRRNVNVAFGVAVAVLVATGSASVWNGARARETARERARSAEHRAAMVRLVSYLDDAESGQRGYLITGRDAFLRPYLTAFDSLPAVVAQLERAWAGDSAQERRLDALRPVMAAALAELEQTVALRREGRGPAAIREVGSGRGQVLMDSVRAGTAAMLAAEDRRVAAYDARLAVAARISSATDTAGAALAVLFLGLALVVVNRDLTRRQHAEQGLARMFALSPDPMITADRSGRFTDVNPAWERLLGWSVAEMRARPFLDFIHPDDRQATADQFAAQQGGQDAAGFTNRYQARDGTYHWLEWNATPFEVDGLIHAVARDVTERRRAEERIQALNEELARNVVALREVNDELEGFSYSVSHDLRAPLRHVSGFADLLEKHAAAALDDKGRRYVATIRQAAQRMGMLIDDLLAFSRVGRAQLAVADVALDDVVRAALSEVREQCDGRDVAFTVRPLPRVRGDRNLLHLALVNLLSNAVKYTRPRPRAEIEVGAREPENGRAVIYVRDNGVGFDMRYADKLFGVFQRLHSADEFEGTGIGLANVQRIVLRHGGRAWAEGAPDRGATFFVALPRAEAAA